MQYAGSNLQGAFNDSVLQCVAVCCSVLKCAARVAVRCSALQFVAVCCSVLQCASSDLQIALHRSVSQCVAVRCSAVQCGAVRCSVLAETCKEPLMACRPCMTPARASEGSDSRDNTAGKHTSTSTSLDGTESPVATDPKILHCARGQSAAAAVCTLLRAHARYLASCDTRCRIPLSALLVSRRVFACYKCTFRRDLDW